jgi:hypothetical protein
MIEQIFTDSTLGRTKKSALSLILSTLIFLPTANATSISLRDFPVYERWQLEPGLKGLTPSERQQVLTQALDNGIGVKDAGELMEPYGYNEGLTVPGGKLILQALQTDLPKSVFLLL